MIANARMYAINPTVAGLWNSLLSRIIAKAGRTMTVIHHEPPAEIDTLWQRADLGAVFMCGLPFSRAAPHTVLVAAPVPSPAEFGGAAQYWSEFVVSRDSAYRAVADTFGGRLALTVPGSQSGCVAALTYFATADSYRSVAAAPLFAQIVAPTVTPLGAVSAVVDGAADIAPIDSYALRLLQVYRPDLTARVRVVGRTESMPIPPLVASVAADSADDPTGLSTAFLEAHTDATLAPLLAQLLLHRFTRPASADYDVLRERFAAAKAYWSSRQLASVAHAAFAW